MLASEIDPMSLFLDAIKSPLTRDRYEDRLNLVLTHMGVEGENLGDKARNFVSKAKTDGQWASNAIWTYLHRQKERAERGEISVSSIPNYWKPLKLLCDMNDVAINWKKITRGIPTGRKYARDRAPTKDEIMGIMEYPDRRIKPIVLTMASSGMRIGAWDHLRWGDIAPVQKDGQIVAAKVLVYRGEEEQYETFATREAFEALKEWMDLRSRHGEKITKDSWVMRDLFNIGEDNGAALPRKLKSTGVKRLIERALWAQGLRKTLENGKRRHEFAADHGFRKFFKSQCEKCMKSIHVEMLMGHSLGLGDSYYRPAEEELLEDYVKAAPYLSFFSEYTGPANEGETQALVHEVEQRIRKEYQHLEAHYNKQSAWLLQLVDAFRKYVEAIDNDTRLDQETKRKVKEAWAPLFSNPALHTLRPSNNDEQYH